MGIGSVRINPNRLTFGGGYRQYDKVVVLTTSHISTTPRWHRGVIGTVVRAIDSEAKLVCSIPTKNTGSYTEVTMRVSNLSFVCGFKPGDIVYTNRSIINPHTKQELLKKNRKGWVIGSAQKSNGRVFVCLVL